MTGGERLFLAFVLGWVLFVSPSILRQIRRFPTTGGAAPGPPIPN